jgi:hypothetical protein
MRIGYIRILVLGQGKEWWNSARLCGVVVASIVGDSVVILSTANGPMYAPQQSTIDFDGFMVSA